MTSARSELRFVVLHHVDVAEPHFDLMLERPAGSQKLMTWRSPVWPIESATVLVRLPDHRHTYLHYEGPISDNRGSVRRITGGVCVVEMMQDESFLTIHFADPTSRPLSIKHVADDQWLAVPSCG